MYARCRDVLPAFAHCDKCPLIDCTHVSGMGPASADLVIVGEAPGETEAEKGVPFIGPSGRMLNRALSEAGINRGDIYVTNSVLGWPEGNRTPKPVEITSCRDRLMAEVWARKPKAILLLGAIALKAFYGKGSIKYERGQPRPWTYTAPDGSTFTATVVPTWHPAKILREMKMYPELAQDIKMVADILGGASITISEPELNTFYVDSPEDIGRWFEHMGIAPDALLSIDVENASDGRLVSLSVCDTAAPENVLVIRKHQVTERDYVLALSQQMARRRELGHNYKSDVRKLWQHGYYANVDEDTILKHYVIDARIGDRGLADLAKDYLQVGDYKAPYRKYLARMEDCPEDILYSINAKDASYTARINNLLDADSGFGEKEQRVYQDLLIPAANVLSRMEYFGTYIDQEALNDVAAMLDATIEQQKEEMFRLVGHEFNPNSTPQLVDILFRELDLPRVSGNSTNKAVMERLKAYSPLPKELLAYRAVQKLRSTYVDNIRDNLDEYSRIHGNFNLHVAVTGRLSSSDPLNLQNIPARTDLGKRIKSLFVPTPGYKMLNCDLSQAELRVLAYMSGDPNLRAVFERGGDPHAETAALIFNKPLESISKDERSYAKQANFGIAYGAEADKINEATHCGMDVAEEVIHLWRRGFSVAWEWLESVRHFARDHGYVTTPLGRTRRFYVPEERKALEEMMRQAGNFPIQCGRVDMPVLTYVGYKPLGNLVPGDLVWDGAEWTPVVYTGTSEKAEWEIRTGLGVTLYYSPDHWFLTGTGWKQVKDLSSSDILVWSSPVVEQGTVPANTVTPDLFNPHWERKSGGVPKKFVVRNKALRLLDSPTEDWAWLLGFTIGDGSMANKQQLSWAVSDQDILQHLIDILGSVGANATVVEKYYNGNFSYYNVTCNYYALRRWLARLDLGYDTAADKHIPGWLLTAPRSYREAFLAGLFDADGGIVGTTFKGFLLTFTTTSRTLAEGVSLLLSSLGVRASVLELSPSKQGYRQYYRVSLPRQFHAVRLPLACSRKQKLWDVVVAYEDAMSRSHDEAPQEVRIVSCTPTGRTVPMADITVASERHAFTTGGVVCHNSLASDITLMAMIRLSKKIDWVHTRLLLTVHDSLVAETCDDADEVGEMMRQEMTTSPFNGLILAADVKTGYRWGDL